MLTEANSPPTGSEVLETGGAFGEASAAGAAGLLTTDMTLLLLLLLLLVVVKGDSLTLGFDVAAEKILNGAAEADVDAGEEAPPKPKDEPNPPKLKADPEELPAVPPLALNPGKPNVCPAVSDFGVEGGAAFGGSVVDFGSTTPACSLGLAGSGVGFGATCCSFPSPWKRFAFAGSSDGGAPNESAGLVAFPPKLKVEAPLLSPPNMEKPGFAASPELSEVVVFVMAEVLAKGLLELNENVLLTGAPVTKPDFSAAAGLDGMGFGN